MRAGSGAEAGSGVREGTPGIGLGGLGAPSDAIVAHAELEPSRIQDLGDVMPQILEIKSKTSIPVVIKVQIEIGDKETPPQDETDKALNKLLEPIDEKFRFER